MKRSVVLTALAAYGGVLVGINGMNVSKSLWQLNEGAPLWLHVLGLILALGIVIHSLRLQQKFGGMEQPGSSQGS